MIEHFHFLRPLWLLLLIPLVWIVWRYWQRRQQGGAWQAVCDAHLLPHLLIGKHTRTPRTPVVLLALAGTLTIIALAGPVWSRLPQPVYHKSDATVVLLSLSDSMNSPDVAPTRLERAKLKLLDFLQRQREGQTALIAYAGEAYVVSPLTDDAATIASMVTSLQSNIMPVSGDNLSEALHKADALLTQDGVARGGRVLLIADNAGDDSALKYASQLKDKGRVLSVLAVGTQQGAPIASANGGFVKDQHGAILIPILNTAALSKLAAAGDGHFVMLSTGDDDLNHLWPQSAGALFKTDAKRRTHDADVWREEGPWLLLLVLPLLALLWRQGWLAVVALAVIIQPPPAHASTWSDLWQRPDQQAYQALQQGDAKTAATLFKDPQWRSIAKYRAGDYADAAAEFGKGHTPDALYNQGNALARAGKLEAAAQNYRKVLQQQPANEDAKHNLKLVEDLLKRQQQKQQQTQQNSSGKSGQQQQQSQQAQSGQQSGKNSQQNPSDQKSAQNPKQAQSSQQSAQNKQQGQTGQQSAQHEQQDHAGKQSGHNTKENSATGQSAQNQKQDQARQQQAKDAKPSPSQQLANGTHQSAQSQQDKTSGSKANGSAVRETKEKSESAQALEQWLRRIPDDPGGLLRRKFMLQHLQREQSANNDI
ncbi:MAG: VWA domain-containing protein [Gammaproteobacteria bacterium]|nr:VWA domain-containing protein [Gammaproteobacteria bacterium]